VYICSHDNDKVYICSHDNDKVYICSHDNDKVYICSHEHILYENPIMLKYHQYIVEPSLNISNQVTISHYLG
jgi:uncharacterized pyridoxamine 5'-phosphate oxidase family protein